VGPFVRIGSSVPSRLFGDERPFGMLLLRLLLLVEYCEKYKCHNRACPFFSSFLDFCFASSSDACCFFFGSSSSSSSSSSAALYSTGFLFLFFFVRFFFVGVHGHYPRRLPRGGGGGAGRGHPSTRAPAFCGSRGALATCWNGHAGLARSPPKRVDRVITAQCATPNLLHTENSVRVWAVSRPRPSKSGSLPNENYSTPSGDPPSVNRKYCGGEERTNSLRQIPFVVLVGMCGS